jgi:hypothetical protein
VSTWTIFGPILRIYQNDFNEDSLTVVPHPPYGPDVALSDFWLFGQIKTSLADRVLNDMDDILESVIEFSNKIQPSK